MKEPQNTKPDKQIVSTPVTQTMLQDLRQIIEQARGHVAATANYALTTMYWHIGEHINREVLGYQRADYGKQIFVPLVRQLSWSHLLQLDKAGIKVAQYMTEQPPREVLQHQIQKSLEAAKARFDNMIEEDMA